MLLRVMSEGDFQDSLEMLVKATNIALAIKQNLPQLGPDDIQVYAELATIDSIKQGLDDIARLMVAVALANLKATAEEWNAANLRVR